MSRAEGRAAEGRRVRVARSVSEEEDEEAEEDDEEEESEAERPEKARRGGLASPPSRVRDSLSDSPPSVSLLAAPGDAAT